MRLRVGMVRMIVAALWLSIVGCTTVQPPPDAPGPPTQTIRAEDAGGVAAAVITALLSFLSVTLVIR